MECEKGHAALFEAFAHTGKGLANPKRAELLALLRSVARRHVADVELAERVAA